MNTPDIMAMETVRVMAKRMTIKREVEKKSIPGEKIRNDVGIRDRKKSL